MTYRLIQEDERNEIDLGRLTRDYVIGWVDGLE